ncbi:MULTISPECIES: toxin-antitoxin system YwqK family antitoxin [Helicobacter]|nr:MULTISPECIES: hypothetical protein [Helicobacter]CUU40418.1 Hypothetical protein BN2458_PEG1535 [Helicobacter typhlonius]
MLKHLIYSTLLLLICVFVGCSDSSVDSLPECVNNEDKIKGCVERDYHHNGQLKIEFPYKNGKENDIAKGYYETGELYIKAPYTDDYKNGVAKEYDKNGKLKQLRLYKNDTFKVQS